MTFKLFLFILIALAIVGVNQIRSANTCASVTTTPALNIFNLASLTGTWYGIRAGSDLSAGAGICLRNSLTINTLSSNFSAYSINVQYSLSNFIMSINAKIPQLNFTVSVKSWILATNFTTYSLLYQCGYANYSDGKMTKSLFISTPVLMSRTPTLPTTAMSAVNTALAANKMSFANLTTIFGTCKY